MNEISQTNKISYRVLKHEIEPLCVWYKVECGCGDDEHTLDIEFEHDKNAPEYIWITFSKKLFWSSYRDCNHWYESFWRRLKCSIKMLLTGYIEVEESFILNGEKHIDSFIMALNEGKQHILNYQAEEAKKLDAKMALAFKDIKKDEKNNKSSEEN